MKELKILYLEDSKQDAEMTAKALTKAGISFSFEVVDNREEYEKALLKSRPDVVLADHSLYHFNSREALKIFKSFDFKIPFILVTGTVSEEFAVNILKEGANDYLLKDNLARLPNAILNSLEKFRIEEERKQYIENVIANEALLNEAEKMAHIGSWDIDLLTGATRWSEEVFRIFGYKPGTFKPALEHFKKHIHPEDVEWVWQNLDEALTNKASFEMATRIVTKTGQPRHVNFKMAIERNDENKAIRVVGFTHDITDIKDAQLKMLESVREVAKLEHELDVQKLQQQKLITEVTIQAQEKERNELGKELHDNINQILTTARMYLGVFLEKPEANLVETSYKYLGEAIEEIRKLSKSLISPTLSDIGLEEALLELKDAVELISDLKIKLEYHIQRQPIDDNQKLVVYRIVQEQINNTLKHAKAQNVTVILKENDHEMVLMIADDGIGFDPSKKAKGIGLKNILSRVQFYSGSFKIDSSVGNGCRMTIKLPTNNKQL